MKQWLAVLLLILVAALIIPRLNNQALWLDEAWTFSFIDHDSPREVVREVIDDRHPPLYFLTVWAWHQAAGDSEVSLRVLSAFAALLTGACLFRWAGALFDRKTGLAALMIFALMDKQVDFSSEVRHYTLLMGWNAAAGWMLVRHLKGQKAGFGYVLAVTGGLYTHVLMFLILGVHALYALLVRGFSKRLMSLWALAGLAFAPWMLVFVYQYAVLGSIHHTFPVTWEVIRLLIPEYLGNPVLLFGGLVLLALVAAPTRSVLLPFLGVAVPALLILWLDFLNERNLSILIPPLAVLIGSGITRFEGFTRGALVIFLLVNGLWTTDAHQILYEDGQYITAPRQQNPPWRELSRLIADRQIDSQPVLSEVGSGTMPIDYHLKRSVGKNVRHVALYDLTRNQHQQDPLTVLRFEKLPDVEGFWYLYWGGDTLFLDALTAWGYTRTAAYHKTHFDDPIYLFRYDSAALLEQKQAVFGDLFTLHQVYAPDEISTGEKLWVSLWWSAVQVPYRDYTVSVFLLNEAGQLVAQHDGFPQENRTPTRTWTPHTLYYDAHPIPIPENLPPGSYQLAVKIYAESGVLNPGSAQEFYIAGSVKVN
ncbi:MAG: glycosyltransferase family 39 protein [Anaerolineae bacterium]|nr:glycosyltransferase family 39 protein [Anaerolineae bacterium]